ncbi:MAG: aminotransferase class V-fold PLP-dependent enzyme, partial [Deltaproteobacteria bacterium]|nr:aminotransferase class V-fold PLP-dependent enzyme [Deltaproteobacteria bacterium]
ETNPTVIQAREEEVCSIFLDKILAIDGLELLGPKPGQGPRVATVSLNISGWSCSDLAAALERDYAIMTRAGLHCAPMTHQHLGSFPFGAVRFSFGPQNTVSESLTAARALEELARARRN